MLKHRPTLPTDQVQIQTWIDKDSDHAGRCSPDFWLPAAEKDSTTRFTMEDVIGPVMFVRGEKVLRLHIQFCPEKVRNARALINFIPRIEADAKKNGFTQIIWDSVSEPLIKFAEKFGYRRSECEIIKDL